MTQIVFLELTIADLIGFVGVGCLIFAYAALQLGKMSADNPLYSLINLVAASLVLFSLFYTFNAASFVIELFWIIISIIGLVRALRK